MIESSASDFTERQALLGAVLRHMPAGIVIAQAPSGRLLMGNEQVSRIWRLPFFPARFIEQYRQYTASTRTGGPTSRTSGRWRARSRTAKWWWPRKSSSSAATARAGS
jgi:hypothetical protein